MYDENYNGDYNTPDYNPSEPAWQPPAPEKPMNWYKFLIFFSLFASAVLNVFNGYQMLTGAQYEGAADLVYAFYSSLSLVDKVVGLALIGVAIFAIYVRQELAKFKANGPKYLQYLYLANAAINVVYAIGFSAAVGGDVELNMTSTITSVIVSVIMVYANKKYFDNRSEMFVN